MPWAVATTDRASKTHGRDTPLQALHLLHPALESQIST
jgi:hypothetical protein